MMKISTTLVPLFTTALLAVGAPALASHGADDPAGDDHGGSNATAVSGGRVVKTGSCSDGSRWKLEVKSDDGRLEVEAELDSNRSGQTWAWKLRDNGAVVARGSSTTGGRSGSFSVERRVADRPGTDSVVLRASRAGEVCAGTLVF